MARKFRVQLNLPLIRENFSREEKRAVPEVEILKWLRDAGFQQAGSYWLVEEPDLGQVDPSEVISADVIDLK